MSDQSFPVELEGRTIDCRTEQERTMLTEARCMCADNRISDRHSADRLRAISKACYEYGLPKMGEAVAAFADGAKH
jgi:hypothetical protein